MSVFVAREGGNIEQAIRDIFSEFANVLNNDKDFFLKPNIVFPVCDKSGQISRRIVVRSIVDVLRDLYPGRRIVIGEGTAAGTDPRRNFLVSGYAQLAEELNVPLLDLDKAERKTIKWEFGEISLPEIVFTSNYINLPILKKSSATLLSGAMKNQKGILSPGMKKKFHKIGLHKSIAYLNQIIKPTLTILDGHNFFPHDNVYISGESCYEIDSLLASWITSDIPDYLTIAQEFDIGCDDYEINGIDIADIKPKYKINNEEYKQLLRFRLWNNPRACSMCRSVFHDIRYQPARNYKYSILMMLKLMKYMIIGAEVIFGGNPQYEKKNKKVICIGDCTAGIAKKNGYVHVPGCPPGHAEMMRYF